MRQNKVAAHSSWRGLAGFAPRGWPDAKRCRFGSTRSLQPDWPHSEATGGHTDEAALRLDRYFGTSAQIQMWMNLQSKYDLAVAEDALSKRIEREVLPLSA